MNKILLIFIFVFFFQALEAQEKVELKILSWNIQLLPDGFALFSKDLRKVQKKRLPLITEYCLNADYDVIVFQEVFDLQLRRKMKKQLKEKYPYHVMHKGKFLKYSSGIAIFSRLPMQKLGHMTFPPGITADRMAAKGITLVEVEKEGKKIQIAGTHLQAGGGEKGQQIRELQYQMSAKLLQEHKKQTIPQVLTGDLNTRKTDDKRYNKMIEILDMQDTPIQDSLPYTSCQTNSWNADSHNSSQIDYILIDKNTPITLEDFKILRLKTQYKGKDMHYSDHYGLEARIQY